MIMLVDTCVVLDLILERKEFVDDAKELIGLIKNKKIRSLITVKSLMDIHYVVKNLTNDENKTRDIIKDILTIFELVSSKSSEALKALYSNIKDYEDALIYETAKTYEVDYIITRNNKDFKNIEINVLTPREILKIIN